MLFDIVGINTSQTDTCFLQKSFTLESLLNIKIILHDVYAHNFSSLDFLLVLHT